MGSRIHSTFRVHFFEKGELEGRGASCAFREVPTDTNRVRAPDRRGRRTTLHVTFTTPNIAAVGLTDEQAIAAGHECECRVVELRHVPRARVNLDTRGLFKIVADRSTGKILGVHVLADNAGDVILAGVYAVKVGMTVDELADTWAPYLTMSEGIRLTAQSFTTNVEMLSCCAA